MMLSIIIPVYKTEKYLDRCIESILMQKVDDIEIILVDDGSPDRSGEMCDEWARKYQQLTPNTQHPSFVFFISRTEVREVPETWLSI